MLLKTYGITRDILQKPGSGVALAVTDMFIVDSVGRTCFNIAESQAVVSAICVMGAVGPLRTVCH